MEIIMLEDYTVLFSDMVGELFKYVRSSSSNVHHLPGWICVCVYVCVFGGVGRRRVRLFLKETSVSQQKAIKF
jgi:hypothetical protein